MHIAYAIGKFVRGLRGPGVTTPQPLMPAPIAPSAPPALALGVQDHPSSQPELKRTYSVDLRGGFRVEIEARSGYGGRRYSGCITQPGNRWVFFEPERVADKIIDRDLSGQVQCISDDAIEQDGVWVANVREFLDENGRRWQLAA